MQMESVESVTESLLSSFKEGDKVVLTVREGSNVRHIASSLKERNVELEIREKPLNLNTLTSSSDNPQGKVTFTIFC